MPRAIYDPNTNTGPGLLSVGLFRDDIYVNPPFGRVVLHEEHSDIGAIDAPDYMAAGSIHKTSNLQLVVTSTAARE